MTAAWQRAMIALARSEHAKRVLRPVVGRTLLAERFVGCANANAAVTAALELRDTHGITASLFYLGEYVDDPARAAETVRQSCKAAELLGNAGLDVHVSADPTAIGFMTGEALANENAERIARRIAAQQAGTRKYLMLDMEDMTLLEPTLELHRHLISCGLPAGITLQARLRRTESDLAPLLQARTAVRLVKGAFPLGPRHDHQGRAAIGQSFVALAERMLTPEARKAGFYPSFATHDDALVERVIRFARANGWSREDYEVEFLYGIRTHWQLELRRRGINVRVYLPFGTDWWPYVMRRIGENPRNLLRVARVTGRR
jgi:proline dehydrogenase